MDTTMTTTASATGEKIDTLTAAGWTVTSEWTDRKGRRRAILAAPTAPQARDTVRTKTGSAQHLAESGSSASLCGRWPVYRASAAAIARRCAVCFAPGAGFYGR